MAKASKQVLSKAGLTIDDLKLVIPHQANKRIIQAVAKSLGVQNDKVFMNVEKYGNTSAASVPIALCEAAEEGRLDANDYVALVGFGAGLSWGAAVLQWGSG